MLSSYQRRIQDGFYAKVTEFNDEVRQNASFPYLLPGALEEAGAVIC